MAKKHRIVRSKIRGIVNPNDAREATMKADISALGNVCRFLGQTVNDGETICYAGNVWVCENGTFQKTDGTC